MVGKGAKGKNKGEAPGAATVGLGAGSRGFGFEGCCRTGLGPTAAIFLLGMALRSFMVKVSPGSEQLYDQAVHSLRRKPHVNPPAIQSFSFPLSVKEIRRGEHQLLWHWDFIGSAVDTPNFSCKYLGRNFLRRVI